MAGTVDELSVRGAAGSGALRAPKTIVLEAVKAHCLLAVVLLAFVLSAFVVPTLAPGGVVEDTIYARSAEILLREGRIEVLPITAETLVFQASWGALFGLVFGDSLGVLRVSTVALVGLSGIAFYGLCLELGISRNRSALGTALYLFNPLTYVLSFSFMSDSYLVALMVIALYCFARGMRGSVDEYDGRWIVAGSVAASCSFLVRQHGALIPLAVVTFLVVTGRLKRDRGSTRLLLQVLAVPVVTVAAYYLWLDLLYRSPPNFVQDSFVKGITDAGVGAIVGSFGRLGFVETMYFGLFVLPLTFAVAPRLWNLVRSTTAVGWSVCSGVAIVMVLGYRFYTRGGVPLRHMPYIPQFLSPTGLGTADLRGGRVPLVGTSFLWLVTLLVALSALVLALVMSRTLRGRRPTPTSIAGLLVTMLVFQALAVVPTSLYLRDIVVSFDRYLLPTIPLVIALTLWALREVRLVLPLAWLVTIPVAVFSVVGTHDFLEYQTTAWRVATEAHAAGIPYRRIDGGSAWGAYRLWEFSYQRNVKTPSLGELRRLGLTAPLLLSRHDVSPWWIGYYAPATRSDAYVVSAEPLLSYTPVRRVEYPSWLSADSTYVYLLRHPGVAGPP